MITGNQLRILRELRGIKQQAIAQMLGISQPAYCKWEKCNCITGKRLSRVLSFLGLTKERALELLQNLELVN